MNIRPGNNIKAANAPCLLRVIENVEAVLLHIKDVEDVAKPDITDGHRLYPGDGVIPLQDILGAVRATGWDGRRPS